MNSTDILWNAVKAHLSLEGLEEVIRLYPQFRDEAETIAKPKRDTEQFISIIQKHSEEQISD